MAYQKATVLKIDRQASLKVKDWLNESDRSFLLIFDNVEQINILLEVWPSSEKGSVLITTRSPLVSERANEVIHFEPFSTVKALEALNLLTGLDSSKDEDSAAANDICHLLGGLPLVMVQMSEYIRNRGYSYEEFLRVYRKSASKIHAKCEIPIEYNLTPTA